MATKTISLAELKQHTDKSNLWVLLHGKVYDVSKFLDEHPGGDEVILSEAGQDATEAFEDVGHSDEARELLPGMLIGEFDQADGTKLKSGAAQAQASRASATNSTAVEAGSKFVLCHISRYHLVSLHSSAFYVLPLALLGGYFAWRYYGGA
ncbi:cytochrome b5-like heme/steroid binding domain-containing protein [Flagelloscypha sp. PMI_526]|nr:cytochrome b5-like heme/steroid binding domain-containing protein [Flagelloscypha sp. PMI_526]